LVGWVTVGLRRHLIAVEEAGADQLDALAEQSVADREQAVTPH
jgi:hypothetical protein